MNKEKFMELRFILDYFFIKNGKVDSKRFEYLYALYNDAISDSNYQYLESLEDDEVIQGFYDSTLKHQVFDYFPYEKFMKRPKKANAWEGMNDLSTVIAGYLWSFGPDEEMVEELEEQIKNYK
jgi:hypothetical protein